MNGPCYPRRVENAADIALLREVGAGLYVGSAVAPVYEFARIEFWGGIDCIFRGHQMGEKFDRLRETAFATMKQTVRAYLSDCSIPSKFMNESVELARTARGLGKPVLVSCGAGYNRSSGVAYGLLRVLDGIEHEEALDRVSLPPLMNHNVSAIRPYPELVESVRLWVAGRGEG